jgi:hypothetical protein
LSIKKAHPALEQPFVTEAIEPVIVSIKSSSPN